MFCECHSPMHAMHHLCPGVWQQATNCGRTAWTAVCCYPPGRCFGKVADTLGLTQDVPKGDLESFSKAASSLWAVVDVDAVCNVLSQSLTVSVSSAVIGGHSNCLVATASASLA